MVPVYELFARFNLVDSYPALILFLTATSLPFGIWLMKGFMDGVPAGPGAGGVGRRRHLGGIAADDSCTVDDAGHRGHYHLYLRQRVGELLRTVHPVGERKTSSRWRSASITFFGQYGAVEYGQLAAFSILYTLPAIGLWVVAARFLRGKFTFAGATKG